MNFPPLIRIGFYPALWTSSSWRSLLLLVAVALQLSFSSVVMAGNPERNYAPAQLQQDFNTLLASIKAVHPSVYAFMPEDSLNALTARTFASLTDSLTESEFHVVVRKFLRHLSCGHTVATPSIEWYEYQRLHSKSLPLEVFLQNDRIYIACDLDKDSSLVCQAEITAINNIAASEILSEMKAIQERDGLSTTFERQKIERLFRTYHLFLYGPSDFYTIEFRHGGKTETVRLPSAVKRRVRTKRFAPVTEVAEELNASFARFYVPESNPELAVLDINGFGRKKYKKFYKAVFKSINQQNKEHLVVDLRGNGGGFFPNGNLLLRYLIDEKFSFSFHRNKGRVKRNRYLKMDVVSRMTRSIFNFIPDRNKEDPRRNYRITQKPKRKHHFSGQLYVLTNGGSFSMSGYVATQLKKERDVTMIGEETGGGKAGTNALLSYYLTLPETQVRVQIPHYYLDHGISESTHGRGLLPDIEVIYSLDEISEKVDKEMEEVKKMMEEAARKN